MPTGAATRPTTDRVREALFSALAAWAGTAAAAPETALAGLAFCDLYAGSGAVGLEAASRGAGPVLLVENDRRTAQLIPTECRGPGPGRPRSAPPASSSCSRNRRRTAYDIVFADPPYERDSATVTGRAGADRSAAMGGPDGVDRGRAIPAYSGRGLAGGGHEQLDPGLR